MPLTRVLSLGTLVLILGTGCATAPRKPVTPPVVTRVVYVPIPTQLTDPLPVYARKAETFGEAWVQAETNTRTLERCNADRAAAAAIQGTDAGRAVVPKGDK